MSTYVYACDSCGAQFEQFQSFKEAPLQTCPACSGSVRRVFQPVGIVFKGSGWYITDSRKDSSTPSASNTSTSTKETKSTDDSKNTTSSDTATTTTTETKSSSTSAPAASTAE
ncbi:MAG: FmdB family zinc ribbon protein [Chloroflexota bacterium]